MADAWVPWLMIGAGAGCYAAWKRGGARWVFSALILLALPFAIFAALHAPGARWPIAAAFVAFALVCEHAFRRSKTHALLRALPVAFFAMAIVLYGMTYTRYQGIYPALENRIAAQPGVRTVYSYRSPSYDTLGPHYMFAAPFDGGHLFGPHDPNQFLVYSSGDAAVGRAPVFERRPDLYARRRHGGGRSAVSERGLRREFRPPL
ncbi:MAG: hypothetical protein M5R36_14210 [Deltaproteobacteria bacterium]|nr:hypothetical protein [Deltaproteobacteria bacterium]